MADREPRVISIAVDIGGTFTDVVAFDSATGRLHALKVPSTPGRLVDAVREGARRALEAAAAGPAQVARFVHGTTVGTNAVLERTGAVVGLLATEGFEDVLELGRLRRSVLYDLWIDAETPVFLAPRRRRRGVRERIGADGSVVVPLDEESARAAIRELRDRHGVDALAVCLLHAYRNPEHEVRVGELAREEAPELGVSLSSEVDPMFREYERTVVTAFDAYLRPVVERYVRELADELRALGIEAPLQVMQSRGGITSAALVSHRPVSVLLSGPAAGVIGGVAAGRRSGFDNLITIDVGGTSADVALVEAGRPLVSTDGRIDRYPLRIPMVDVSTVGAGGGSIAWLDGSGGFHVGPRSAGAEPGPACYGRGGTEPTVTDASLALGYLDAETFAGGTVALDPEAALAALGAFGDRLGLSAIEAAAGIHRVVNARMADEIGLVSVRRGYDPRTFALVLLGGAGPLHGGRLAAELAIPTMLVPPTPGVLSALGLLEASVEHDRAETVAVRTADAEPAALEAAFARLEASVAERMRADRVPDGAATTSRSFEMRYAGQSYTLEVPVGPAVDGAELELAVAAFHAAHDRSYGHATPANPTEIVNVRVVQVWAPQPPGSALAGTPGRAARSRRAYFDELGGLVETPVLGRAHLQAEVVGPAIVEQPDTTLVVYPEHRAVLDAAGNVVVTAPPRVASAR